MGAFSPVKIQSLDDCFFGSAFEWSMGVSRSLTLLGQGDVIRVWGEDDLHGVWRGKWLWLWVG